VAKLEYNKAINIGTHKVLGGYTRHTLHAREGKRTENKRD